MTVEAFIGLVLATFTQPNAAVLWSRAATISMHEGKPTLMTRMANARGNRFVQATVLMTAALSRRTERCSARSTIPGSCGERARSVPSRSAPCLCSMRRARSTARPKHRSGRIGLEIIVLLSGVDETSGQTVHARTAYAAEELCFGQRFRAIILIEPDDNRMIDYRIFHKTQPSPLPLEHLPSFAVTSGPVAAST